MTYLEPYDLNLDDSSLTRAQKRAALFEMQAGRCAMCGSEGVLVADHDHETGRLRGLLCRSCNSLEGRYRPLFYGRNARIEAYLAAPPAGHLGWMWDLPDPVLDPAIVIAMGRGRKPWTEA